LQTFHLFLGFFNLSVTWGVCFSLKANPNGENTFNTGTLLAQGTATAGFIFGELEASQRRRLRSSVGLKPTGLFLFDDFDR
jgi:hypothetical protein